jgi:hypothetical protein
MRFQRQRCLSRLSRHFHFRHIIYRHSAISLPADDISTG